MKRGEAIDRLKDIIAHLNAGIPRDKADGELVTALETPVKALDTEMDKERP